MPVTLHPTRWWDWCLSEGNKKGTEPSFWDKFGKWYKVGARRWEIVKVNVNDKNAFTVRQ